MVDTPSSSACGNNQLKIITILLSRWLHTSLSDVLILIPSCLGTQPQKCSSITRKLDRAGNSARKCTMVCVLLSNSLLIKSDTFWLASLFLSNYCCLLFISQSSLWLTCWALSGNTSCFCSQGYVILKKDGPCYFRRLKLIVRNNHLFLMLICRVKSAELHWLSEFL